MTVGNLAGYLEASAKRFPERTAVIDSAGFSMTYAELNRQADALACMLQACGVRRGDRVGIVLPKGLPALVAIFGALKAGAAYVPIDHAAPAERSRRILTECRIRALVVDHRCLHVIPRTTTDGPAPMTAIVVGSKEWNAQSAPSSSGAVRFVAWPEAIRGGGPGREDAAQPQDLAYVLYTSGSTGMPKGAMITHANAMSFIDWCSSTFDAGPEDRFANHAPFHFDASVFDIYVSIRHGASVYLVSEDLGKDPARLARFIAANRLTVWFSTPSILTLLVQFGNLQAHDSSSLRLVLFGGEVFPVRYLRALRQCWQSAAYYNLYGPTEITTACTFAKIPSQIPDEREEPYPIGFPCSHCRTLVLDEAGREVAAGEAGMLWIAGPSVFAGYWERPAETAAVTMQRDGTRWYNTGDVVRFDPTEGLHYVGRRDRMVKRRGYRIELGEIESALHVHPHVREAAVVACSDGDGAPTIAAFLACAPGGRPSVVDLKTFCATRIPAYMSPDRFLFRENLPRTASGKVDYQALVGQLVRLVSEPERPSRELLPARSLSAQSQ